MQESIDLLNTKNRNFIHTGFYSRYYKCKKEVISKEQKVNGVIQAVSLYVCLISTYAQDQ